MLLLASNQGLQGLLCADLNYIVEKLDCPGLLWGGVSRSN